jgi:acyl transferase domain-containing protein
MSQSESFDTDIAIIGMAGRFPGAPNVESLWQNLRDGVEAITFFSQEELLVAGVDPEPLDSPHYVRAAGVLDDIAGFDAAFFSMTPREAEITDPQHRLFLETAWAALEDAGYTAAYPGLIGVYAGCGANAYLYNLSSQPALLESLGEMQTLIGNAADYLATRVSYKLNLKGPSISVQTACSTSLVAVHLACQSLLHSECDMALAGGVSLDVPHRAGYLYQEGGITSPDGHCRAFDAHAQGTVGGSGVALVVLKRLSDALADGDCIHAVIKGSAVNNDGWDKIGFTAPSIQGQAEVIAEALAVAGIHPETISYIEAHGTGTALGDPIEVAALTQVFRASTRRTGFCALGSVKTNLGHLDAAAGVTGLLKVTLALKHRQLPPSLHFTRPNARLNLESSPFYVNTTLRDWTSQTPLRAGVSAFGLGGTNAHVVLEEAPRQRVAPEQHTRPWQMLLLSAKTETALEVATQNLAAHLRQHADQPLADVAYTLQIGRQEFEHRRLIVCENREDALRSLDALDVERVYTGSCTPGAHGMRNEIRHAMN